MRELLFPSTDAGVAIQLAVLTIGGLIVLIAVWRRPNARLLVFGVWILSIALFGVRALH
ncbi:MAG: hypothetical protein HKN07_02620 [Acidimicrobiia bacterium]|nr:hypothetical protein [Acidimicrobiia bacterium]NNF63129.1 hypothetical protein [Acidimicrobiia bacterium]